jgi:hypothetical protein
LVEQRTENPRVGGSIPSLAIRTTNRFTRDGNKLRATGLVAAVVFCHAVFRPSCPLR